MRTLEFLLFWILLIDSTCCVLIAWYGKRWYTHHFRTVSRIFPPAKGWAALYLVLVLVIGFLVLRSPV